MFGALELDKGLYRVSWGGRYVLRIPKEDKCLQSKTGVCTYIGAKDHGSTLASLPGTPTFLCVDLQGNWGDAFYQAASAPHKRQGGDAEAALARTGSI